MVGKAVLLTLAVATLLPSGRAAAQDAPVNGVVYLYKPTDRCPTDADGNEITVCVRRSPSEQYRIPKDLRPESLKPEYQSFVRRADELTSGDLGGSGDGSCSTSGIGGTTGCAQRAFAAARREAAQRKAAREAAQPK